MHKETTHSDNDILKVIQNENDIVDNVPRLTETLDTIEKNISASEDLLESIGYVGGLKQNCVDKQSKSVCKQKITPFNELLSDANVKIPNDVSFLDLLSQEDIEENSKYIKQLNDDFNNIHKLDEIDVIIPVISGILGGAIDCAFGGFLRLENGKSVPGPFSKYFDNLFDKALPLVKIDDFENLAKVTYDATDNRNTTVHVDVLSAYFHRLLSLGHDPILGFIVGTIDMLKGTMTTLDFKGKFVIQVMDVYDDRKAQELFEAISKVFLHMVSDVNTPQGLPVPFMALFNKLQLGSIGEEELKISEVVKAMYGQGYDFRHFCAMSIPVMITEVIVRIAYFFKRHNDGYSFKDSIPLGGNREKKPKLDTMLFIAHSTASAINAGKVMLTKNPLNINYPQWLFFILYSIKQLKWTLYDKPELRNNYVMSFIQDEWDVLYNDIDLLWNDMIENNMYHLDTQ